MKKNLLFCPSCGERLHISKISCDNCGIEINGNFEIPFFDEDEYEFIKDFIMFEGNISKMQLKYGETYKVIKDKINNIKEKIGGEKMCKNVNVDFSHDNTDSAVIQCLQKKIQQCAGKGYIPSLKVNDIPFWIADDQSGFVVKQLKNVVFSFEMFDDMISKIREQTALFLLNINVEKKPEPKQVAKPIIVVEQKTAKAESRVGRNSLCPCGSGKKYKNCCGK